MRVFLVTGIFAACLCTPALAETDADKALEQSWGFVSAQCWQEQVAEPRHICQVGLDDEPSLAIITSSIAPFFDDALDLSAIFSSELKRLHGLEIEGREIGPFATWQEAEKFIDDGLPSIRRIEGGKLAFLAVSLEPERLTEEPNAEEIDQLPPPIPDLTAAWHDETATLWRTDNACGLRSADGREIRPELVTNPFGEAGEGCPFQVAEGYGIYAFHVARGGALCGEAGICTEFYDPDGNLMLAADYSPNPLPVHRDLHGIGLIMTGERIQRLWSFTERRYLTEELPFLNVGSDDRVTVSGGYIRHNRLAVIFEHHRAGNEEPDYATFFLDTRRFEEIALRNPPSLAPETAPPRFAAFETESIDACADGSSWLLDRDQRAESYLRQSYFDFDKHFRAFTGTLWRDIDAAAKDPAQFARIAARLDALMPRLGRLLNYASAPADSLQVARIAGSFDFQSPDLPDPDDGHTFWLRAALAQEMVGGFDVAADEAGERIDAFLTSLGRVRYRLRMLEAASTGDDVERDTASLREVQALVRDWRDGLNPVINQAIFGGPPRLGERLHPHMRAMCGEG
jgi:hypothetical protein